MDVLTYAQIENPTIEQSMANAKVKAIGAPLGLYEWKCSDGEIYLKSTTALAHEIGLTKKEKDDG